MLFLNLCCQIGSLLHCKSFKACEPQMHILRCEMRDAHTPYLVGSVSLRCYRQSGLSVSISSLLCCACSNRSDCIICGVLGMVTALLVPKTKVLPDFGKFVFYLNYEQRVYLFPLFALCLPPIQVFIFNQCSVNFP